MKTCVIFGTRPEIIKMSPILNALKKSNIDFFTIHSNQHYSPEMDTVFFKELGLSVPEYNLNIGSATHPNQIGNMLIKMEPILIAESPSIVLVQGDTNTVVAGALTANKLSIPLGHVEAGLRSYDRTMPEEINRVITDHLSDHLFAVSKLQQEILQKEGIEPSRIYVVGNTIVDAVITHKEAARKKSDILSKLNLCSNKYILFTSHRASNVDKKEELEKILEMLESIKEKVCWPIHPRTKKFLTKYCLEIPKNAVTSGPVGYLDFLNLEQNAFSIVTDSGGVQEEACILGVPCVTIRDNTERPETINVGSNVLVGRDIKKMLAALDKPRTKWKNPFGDGCTAQKILSIICGEKGER